MTRMSRKQLGKKIFWLTMVSYLPAAIFNIGPIFLALSEGKGVGEGEKKRKKKKREKRKESYC